MTLAPSGIPRERWVALGDPQAPLEKVMAILDAYDLLGDDGRLSPRAGLVSMGDHFDFDVYATVASDLAEANVSSSKPASSPTRPKSWLPAITTT